MSYAVEFSPESDEDLRQFRTAEQRRIVEAIEKQLRQEPDVATRNRKCLGDQVMADFEYIPPLWELRVGEFRVFYEIDAAKDVIYIHAVRRKPPHKTTGDVLNETNDR